MKGLILAEYERIWARKSTKVLLSVAIGFQILNFLLYQKHWNIHSYVLKKGLEIQLNNLNYPVTQLLDFNALVILVILPLFFSECLSSEIDTGAYKMIALKPIKRWKLLVAKWLALLVTYTITLIGVYAVKSIIGNLFMPRVNSTTYFFSNSNFNIIDSIVYNLKYYLIILAVHLSIMGIVSFISVIVKKTLLTMLVSITCIIMSIYLFSPMSNILFKTTDMAFYMLAGQYDLKNIFIYGIFILFCFIGSLFIWNKRINKMV